MKTNDSLNKILKFVKVKKIEKIIFISKFFYSNNIGFLDLQIKSIKNLIE